MSATLDASVMQIRLDQINSLGECKRTKDEQPHLYNSMTETQVDV